MKSSFGFYDRELDYRMADGLELAHLVRLVCCGGCQPRTALGSVGAVSVCLTGSTVKTSQSLAVV